MKAKRILIQICLLCAVMLPVIAQAQFIFTTNNDGSLNIYQYSGSGGAVTIPSTTNGLPVTSIGKNAFLQCYNLANLIIPDSVISIGEEAFGACYYVTNITIGTNVASIGEAAFFECSDLTSVTIPSSVTNIGDSAFYACTGLTAIMVETNNPAYCSVAGVLFNEGQTLLVQCPGAIVGNYSISNNVTSIGHNAFWDCTKLTSVTIPSSVTSIGDTAFGGCTSLTAITVETNNPAYCSVAGVLFNEGHTTLIQCPGAKAGNYSIPNTVISIGDDAFWSCTKLTSITIPDSVSSIGFDSFAFCYDLNSLTIPSSVTSIETEAFWYCINLTSVYFIGNAPTIGSNVFADDSNVAVYYLPGTIGWGQFSSEAAHSIVLWNPQAQTSGASFGVRTNKFGFNIAGKSGEVIVVEACTNLVNPIWSPLGTNTLTNGASYFGDSKWTNYPGRFYRLRSP